MLIITEEMILKCVSPIFIQFKSTYEVDPMNARPCNVFTLYPPVGQIPVVLLQPPCLSSAFALYLPAS